MPCSLFAPHKEGPPDIYIYIYVYVIYIYIYIYTHDVLASWYLLWNVSPTHLLPTLRTYVYIYMYMYMYMYIIYIHTMSWHHGIFFGTYRQRIFYQPCVHMDIYIYIHDSWHHGTFFGTYRQRIFYQPCVQTDIYIYITLYIYIYTRSLGIMVPSL